jgi:hypothetical protein
MTGTILSVDVGIKNLAACVLKPGNCCSGAQDLILEWMTFDVTLKKNAAGVCEAILGTFCRWIEVHGVTMAVIERQPSKSMGMKRMEAYIEMICTMCGISKTVVVDSKLKLSRYPSTGLTYYQRKKAAVKAVTEFLESTKTTNLVWESAIKKDDLADCFLQAQAVCHGNGILARAAA